jgi:ankyrin repeat protein
MTLIHKLRRGCLWLLAIGGVVVFTPIAIAIFFFSRPSLHSTEFSPDGRFKMEVWLDPMFIAMPGSGGDSNKSGTVYVSNTSGFPLGSASFDMLMNLDTSWETDKVNISGGTWDLPKSDDPNILLFHAAMRGNSLEFTKLLPKVNLQFRTSHNRTFIHAAVIGKNLEIIEQLLQNKVDVNIKDKEGDTALQLATEKNSIPVVKLLLKYGADARERKEIPREIFSDGRQAQGWQETPLLHALEYGHLELAEILIANGADVNVVNRNQTSPLEFAAELGNINLMKQIIDRGASINSQNSNKLLRNVVFGWEKTQLQKQQVIEFMISKGASINSKNSDELLEAVMQQGDKTTPQQKQQAIEFLITKGASLKNSSVLNAAIFHNDGKGDLSIINYLIDRGANVNSSDRLNGSTPIMAIVREFTNSLRPYGNKKNSPEQYQNIIDRMLAKGADINAQDNYGNTSVYEAIVGNRNNLSVIEFLLKRGAKVNIADKYQRTPLMTAVTIPYDESPEDRIKLINLLIENGADVNAKDKDGKTAFDLTNDPIIRQQLQKIK